MFASLNELVEVLKLKFGVTSDSLTDGAYEDAARSAMKELGWALPIAHPLKEFWIVERATRHSIFILMIESARKFRYKQIHLQNRFEHYNKVLTLLDSQYTEAKKENPELFASSVFVDSDTLCNWITYIPNAREYNYLGKY